MDLHANRKAIDDLSKLYGDMQEATYGQSAGQELSAREKRDDAAGAPNPKKKARFKVTDYDLKHTEAGRRYKAGNPNYTKEDIGGIQVTAIELLQSEGTLGKEVKALKKGAETLKNKDIKKADEIAEKVAVKELTSIYSKMQTAPQELDEKQKDTPDQVKAVIAYDKARKGTDDATYDSEHGKKKQAKKERDYAKWQRDQGAEFAQKSGDRWKHAPGSTREREGKKSVKHAHIKDSFSNWKDDLKEILPEAITSIPETEPEAEKEIKEKNIKNKVVIDPELKLEAILQEMGATEASLQEITEKESQLWDEVAERLTELHELGGVKFRVVPFIDEVDRLGKSQVSESGWHRRNPEKVGTPADPDSRVLKGSGKVKTYAQTKKENPPTNPKRGGIYKPNKDGKMVKVDEAKVDTGKSADEKSIARNKRNTPPGADKDTDLKTFITRKPGESLDSARQRVRQGKHAARRGGSHNKSSSQGQMMSGKSTIYK